MTGASFRPSTMCTTWISKGTQATASVCDAAIR